MNCVPHTEITTKQKTNRKKKTQNKKVINRPHRRTRNENTINEKHIEWGIHRMGIAERERKQNHRFKMKKINKKWKNK